MNREIKKSLWIYGIAAEEIKVGNMVCIELDKKGNPWVRNIIVGKDNILPSPEFLKKLNVLTNFKHIFFSIEK